MTMSQRVLVCGSISYDTIMSCDDRFKDHILPQELDRLNLAFHVPRLRREFGGCAVNICYNLRLLGCRGVPVATVGDDFDRFRKQLDRLEICQDLIKVIDGQCTPQDHITTDPDNNQIALFHPGAMDFSHLNPLDDLRETALGLVSPDGLDGMRLHARQFADAGVPFIFDPGQITPLLGKDKLLTFVDLAQWAIFNSYEWQTFRQKTGWAHEDLASRLEAHIVTSGSEGSTVYHGNRSLRIPAATVASAGDPTGCGDAYRAGVVFGLLNRLDWRTTGQLASTVGAICYESPGTQNHLVTPDILFDRYTENYGDDSSLKALLIAG